MDIRYENGAILMADVGEKLPDIANSAVIKHGSYIYSGSKIGDRSTISHGVVVEEGCQIGERVFIGHGTILRPGTVIGHRSVIGHLSVFEGKCTIGRDVLIHSQCHITKGVIIEDDVFIAPLFVGANDPQMCHSRRHMLNYVETPYKIERAARIGVGVKVLPGVVIGENSIVGSGSVVTRDIPAREVWMGVPARHVRDVNSWEWLTD